VRVGGNSRDVGGISRDSHGDGIVFDI